MCYGVLCMTIDSLYLSLVLLHICPRKIDDSHDSFLLPSDYASSSDSDAGMTVVDQAWRGDADSDAESIDSEQEDPLK